MTGVRRAIHSLATMGVLLTATAGLATAQDRPATELSAGYTYLRDIRTDVDFSKGWMVEGSRRLGPAWAVVQFDRSIAALPLVIGDASVSVRAIMAGARVAGHIGRFREFLQLLAGDVRGRGVLFGNESAESRFAIQPGIGLDVPLMRTFGARLQFDDRLMRGNRRWTQVELRLLAAVVYSFD